MLHSSANCIFAYKFSLTQRHQTSKPKHHLVQIMVPKALLFTVMLLAFAAESAPSAQAQLLELGQLLINGTVYCSTGPVTATTPVFPSKIRFSQALHFSSAKVLETVLFADAGVQLQCGSSVVKTATTNSNGVFSMQVSFITSLLSTLLSDCRLVVTTPLSTCGLSLPTSGLLQSALQLLNGGGAGGLFGGILGTITNIVPSGFTLFN